MVDTMTAPRKTRRADVTADHELPSELPLSAIPPDVIPGKTPTTTVKCYVPQRDIIAQICPLLGLNQQDVLLLFWETMRLELLRLLEARQQQLRAPRG